MAEAIASPWPNGNLTVHIFSLAGLFLVFCLFGYGIYGLIFRQKNLSLASAITLIPVLGLCNIAIYTSNLIALSVPLQKGNPFFIGGILLLDLLALFLQRKLISGWLRKHSGFFQKREDIKKYIPLATVLLGFAVLAYFVLTPINGLPLTTPWRIGPDAAGYVNLANFLAQGGTLDGMSGDFTRPTDIYAYLFMVQYLRRSCAGVLAFIAQFYGQDAGEIALLAIAFCLILCAVVAFNMARILLSAQRNVTGFFIAGAIVLNCNLLFILYEGSYAQIMAMPILLVMIVPVLTNATQHLNKREAIALYGMMLAATCGIYLESLIILPLMLGGLYVMRFLLKQPCPVARDIFIAAGALGVAFVLSTDVMVNWLALQEDNRRYLTNAGWPQPEWALLPQIMGWVDIYHNVTGNNPGVQNTVPGWQRIIGIIFSLSALAGMAVMAFRKNSAAIAALVGLGIITTAYIYFHHWLQIHNYSYMKIYTMALPLLTTGLLASLAILLGPRIGPFAVAGLAALTIVQGLGFMQNYRKNYAVITPGMLELKQIDRETDLKAYTLLTLPQTDEHQGIREIFLHALIPTALIDPPFFAHQNFTAERKKTVALIINYAGHGIPASAAPDILWKGSQYLILKTGMMVEDIWKDKGAIKWARLTTPVPRPEITVHWIKDDARTGVAGKIDFAPYYAVGQDFLKKAAER
jgi:hypothetical protein